MNTTSNVPGANLQLELMAVGHRYKIAALYVFGSRAEEIAGRVRGQAVSSRYADSDVDIGVQPTTGHRPSAQERVRLSIELEELLGVNRVDLVVLPEADPFLALDIIRGELLYCADEDAQAEDELYVLRRAGDLAYHERARHRQILGVG
ncbi:MAG: nucleotidyltransferase domain-containing protein [Anaerolineae bacterium]